MKFKGLLLAAVLAAVPLVGTTAPSSAVVIAVGVRPGHWCGWHHACWRYRWHGGYYNYYWHNRYWRSRWRCGPRWCYR